MTQRLEELGTLSVSRGSAFALLGIFTTMLGCAADMVMSLKVGGFLALIVSLVLLNKARRAMERNFRNTELWVLLDERDRPPRSVAQQLIGTVLREIYLRYAQRFAFMAGGLLALAVFFAWLHPDHRIGLL